MVAKCSLTIQHISCKVSTFLVQCFLICLCVSVWKELKTKTWPVITSNSHGLPQTLMHKSSHRQRESVYTSCYHSIIPDSQILQSMCSSDNVALPRRWTIYPVPHYFGAISLKPNKIVCTCSMLRQPFPNKTQALSTASESAVIQTHPQTSLTQTTWEIIATQSEPPPELIPNRKCAIYNNSQGEY